jgi:hypothetical protein
VNLQVKPENRQKFERAALKWHRLVKVIGWKDLASMYIKMTPPFQDAPPLTGTKKQKIKQAKQILLNEMAAELKESGLEVIG